MRALISLGLDLLHRPGWFVFVASGLLAAGWLAVIADRRAKRANLQAELDALMRQSEFEYRQELRAQRIHRSARSIVHPDEAA